MLEGCCLGDALGRGVKLLRFKVIDRVNQDAAELARGEMIRVGLKAFIHLAQRDAQAIDEGGMLAGHGNRVRRLHIGMDAPSITSVGVDTINVPTKRSGILRSEMFATCKLVFVYVALGIPAGLFGIPYSLLVGNTALLYRMVVGHILHWGVRTAGIRVVVIGRERVPEGVACIILPNHVSNLDPPVVFPAVPGMAAAMLKKELMRIPLLGTGMRLGGFVPVERSSRREDAQASVEKAAETLRGGMHVLIFAEGTRSKNGRLQPFKRGPFYLAMQTGAPVVPVAITGTEKMMRKGSVAITPGVAHVEFLEPVWPKDFATREELMAVVRERMVAALPEEMRPVG